MSIDSRPGRLHPLPLAAVLAAAPGTAAAQEAAVEDPKLWDSEAELGISTASGNSESATYTGAVSGERESGRTHLLLQASGRYSEEEGESTTQRLQGDTQLDYDLNASVYAFGAVAALNDRFAGYELQLIETLGIGRHFFQDHETLEWRLDAGPALRQDWLVDDTYEDSVNARVRTKFAWAFAENSSFQEQITWTQSVENADEFLLSSETSLSLRVNESLAFKTSVAVEHDSQPPEGAERTDVFTSTSLLYQF
ncbi:DUF481 domain-containing protein [Thiohalorhabdus denitrificans]|uniref:Salt-induced outer membrane protein n=1 Tax=Thiohalorhabdus denitrificans TaxID=381306 RepID=A0A1G5AJ13_9GAMM|nr:DUF481 domain-containing protein [Thiohalorhabdus denitrificans]SCX77856.1 Protein of unknown function, DUF481 [Thiohalorhabdus denitrificans]